MSVPVREYVGGWLRDQAGAVAESTLAFYRGALNGWLQWLGPRAEQGIDLIGREDVAAWRATEMARVRAKTVTQRIKALRAVMRAALRDGMIAADPTDGVRAPKAPARERKVRRPFTREEIERVLELADGDWRLMIQLGLQTGQRLGDLVRMDWRDLDLGKGIWTLTAGKTDRRVLVPLGEGVLAELQARGPRPLGDVFPQLVAEVERSRGYVGGLSKRFAHLLHLAGLRTHSPYGDDRKRVGSDDRREQQELSFHSLRHTSRSWLEEAGQPKAVIDAYVGHSGDMGRQYTTVGMEALRAAAAVLQAVVIAPTPAPETQNPQR
jgi:integrase